MKRTPLIILLLIIVVVSGVLGWQFVKTPGSSGGGLEMPANSSANGVVQDDSGKTVLYWYDPMVPAQKFDKPGKSPFMDMMLEPKYAESDDQNSGVGISAQTLQNLGIRLAMVEQKKFGGQFLAVGRIEPDERRFYTVQPRIPGFVEKLMVRAVGDPVRKGQKIAEIYAPELLAAQQEYLALLRYENASVTDGLAQAARSRLNLLGMTEGEINAIAKSGQPTQRFGVYAPASGILMTLGVREGGQIMAGASLVEIADLSTVWLIAEVPEQDVMQLKIGSPAEVTLHSLPGELFEGKLNYIYPTLDEATRTVRVRIELANSGGLLRTGMYGNVMLAGASYEALSVPTESVIATGTRKVVITKQDNGFLPVEIETGQERDGYTEILQGLKLGEQVVASGQFLIDSEASLSGVLARLAQQPVADAEMPAMEEHAGHDMEAMSMQEKMPEGKGRVVDIDVAAGKVTLAHEPIPELGWPSMTMGFNVPDHEQLRGLKPGDHVEFKLKADATTEQYNIEQMSRKAGVK
jgi:membrane fusion protein, copper/silver efflux system